GMPFEWAFLMDAFQAERDQGITIDTAQIWLRAPQRDYVIIDAPGHREFIKNMVTGAATADAALVLIDAGQGIQQQSRLHGFLLHLLGIRQLVVIVNKMDMIEYSQARFDEIRTAYAQYLESIGFSAAHFIPVSARDGDNIANRAATMPWYGGPPGTEALGGLRPAAAPAARPARRGGGRPGVSTGSTTAASLSAASRPAACGSVTACCSRRATRPRTSPASRRGTWRCRRRRRRPASRSGSRSTSSC